MAERGAVKLANWRLIELHPVRPTTVTLQRRTSAHARALDAPANAQAQQAASATIAGALPGATVPLRRLGELKELDGPFLLLASEAGAYMSGSVLAVDGGHLVGSL